MDISEEESSVGYENFDGGFLGQSQSLQGRWCVRWQWEGISRCLFFFVGQLRLTLFIFAVQQLVKHRGGYT